jgi:hypothetical protein
MFSVLINTNISLEVSEAENVTPSFEGLLCVG